MYAKSCCRISIILLITIICTGCTITIGAPSELYTVSFTDASFPVTGNVLEKDNSVTVIEHEQRVSFPPAAVFVSGEVYRNSMWVTSSIIRTFKMNYFKEETYTLLGKQKVKYCFDGTVLIDGSKQSVLIEFDSYADSTKFKKQFILTKAKLEQIRLECEDPFDVVSPNPEFPCLLGYAHILGVKYPMYAVLDNWPGKQDFGYNAVVYNQLQKFQFLNEDGVVVAELERDVYTLYDTMPEGQEESFKKAIALLLAYRHSTWALRNLEDSWDLPRDYRYIN